MKRCNEYQPFAIHTKPNMSENSRNYPCNLFQTSLPNYHLASLLTLLDEKEVQLFGTATKASVNFWELDVDGKAFWNTVVNDIEALQTHLARPRNLSIYEPRCRYLFIHARNSRERLNISRDMFTYALSYLQVMPEFLDLIFKFGHQEHPQELNHSGFRQRTCLQSSKRTMQIPELGWSGYGIQQCYSLKFVERSISQQHWPWSIRHCAVYHSFDVEHIRTNWIIIKGDRETERRIQNATKDGGPPELSSYDNIVGAFSTAMETHLLMFDSAIENWRWYISFLEQKSQDLTRAVKSVDAKVALSPIPETPLSPISRTATFGAKSMRQFSRNNPRQESCYEPTGYAAPKPTVTLADVPSALQVEKPPELMIYTNLKTGRPQPLPPGRTVESLESPQTQRPPNEVYGQQQFDFNDLQKVQHVEEKANEALLAMSLNLRVILQTGKYYQYLIENHDLPHDIRVGALGYATDFVHRIDGIKCNVQLQTARTEAVLRLLANRKSLLHSLLDFQNMQINKTLAAESHNATKNMEYMTKGMHHMTRDMSEVARKTKTETVSMRIITLVTLFFLPGTFISVGCFLFASMVSCLQAFAISKV